MTLDRLSGLLLHVTSLPSPYGMGDLGPAAYRFADFLEEAGQEVWQVLPLVPLGLGYSPYSSPSTFAGNPWLISPEFLREDGLLEDGDLADTPDFPGGEVDYERAVPYKQDLLQRAFRRFEAGDGAIDPDAFATYREEQSDWLPDYTLFRTLKSERSGEPWTRWAPPLRDRDPEALAEARERHAEEIRMRAFWQFLFERQWQDLHAYCGERGIRIFGDLPIYVSGDSADVWAHQELFKLDEDGRPTVVAGVPPDYFSETGQRWGNPIYRWERMRQRGYAWWTRRFTRTLEMVDVLRIDHFRGFEAFWEIPAEEETAINGNWVDGPGASFFETVREELGHLPLVAEDLGLITPEVHALMDEVGLPGMTVVQFGFSDGPSSTHMPHHFPPQKIAYTGTHDNDTIAGWWSTIQARARHAGEDDHDEEAVRTRRFVREYLDLTEAEEQAIHWPMIRLVSSSSARWAILPVQDVLGLGSEARMNVPGHGGGNWRWQLESGALSDRHAHRLAHLSRLYDRTPSD